MLKKEVIIISPFILANIDSKLILWASKNNPMGGIIGV
jgi:hypothetical protein|tara:strand:+ start:525 stop:638 length:114 start_codon:yes stop_codon:yes gene_type:complete